MKKLRLLAMLFLVFMMLATLFAPVYALEGMPEEEISGEDDEQPAYPEEEPIPDCLIRVEAGENGYITPGNWQRLFFGDSVSFEVVPQEGYIIDTVMIDDVEVPLSDGNIVKIENVSSDHTITATFRKAAPVWVFVAVAVLLVGLVLLEIFRTRKMSSEESGEDSR